MAKEFKKSKNMLAYLPREIIIDILSRLPFPNIMRCRCVCKSWLSLIGTHELIMSYFRKSSFPHGLALVQDETRSKPLKFLEFIDGYRVRSSFSFSFDFPHNDMIIHSSANGLLFLKNLKQSPHFICNPITGEYIKLPPPNEACSFGTYGFGVSKLTGQYKVVRLFQKYYEHPYKCEVYTVGTRSWRSIAADVPLTYTLISNGVFFNGNLHWLERSSDRILCFDLETERFSAFSTPVLVGDVDRICALGDCFYLCENSYRNRNTVIWLMNENRDDKSWRKEYNVTNYHYPNVVLVPIKIFRDGDILFTDNYRLYYSRQTYETLLEIKDHELLGCRVVTYTPSFLQLKTFVKENVSSLVLSV